VEAFRRPAASDNIPPKLPPSLCLLSSSSFSGIGDGREETRNGRMEVKLRMIKKRLGTFMLRVVLKLREN
jgi:hypothetical protein